MTEPSAYDFTDAVIVKATPADLFAYLDDHRRMSASAPTSGSADHFLGIRLGLMR